MFNGRSYVGHVEETSVNAPLVLSHEDLFSIHSLLIECYLITIKLCFRVT